MKVNTLLGESNSIEDLGACIGGDLFEREIDYLVQHEFALYSEDILYRRTKLGLILAPEEVAILGDYLKKVRKNDS